MIQNHVQGRNAHRDVRRYLAGQPLSQAASSTVAENNPNISHNGQRASSEDGRGLDRGRSRARGRVNGPGGSRVASRVGVREGSRVATRASSRTGRIQKTNKS